MIGVRSEGRLVDRDSQGVSGFNRCSMPAPVKIGAEGLKKLRRGEVSGSELFITLMDDTEFYFLLNEPFLVRVAE
jgi:hypothetical protein